MTEQTGIARALEVLGNKIAEVEEKRKSEADELREKNKELTAQLKQAEEDRDAACAYALQLERMLEECRKVYTELKEGGGELCKKS